MNNVMISKNIIAFHPGYYVNEYINNQGMSQSELASRMEVSKKTISKIVNGKADLTDNLIDKLALSIGTSKELWTNLNNNYKDAKKKVIKENNLQKETNILKQINYNFFKELGVVGETNDTYQRIFNLKKFFKISSLSVLNKNDFLVQFRTAVNEIQNKNIINSNAWVQTALNLGSNKNIPKINIEYLKNHLSEIRNMTLKEPKYFMPRLEDIFDKSGIAFVLLPNLKNCGINGAVTWFGSNNEHVLLAMNNRRKYADTFWFSLFHEIKHVLQQKKGHIIITPQNNQIPINSALNINELEKDADNFAKNYLIDINDYNDFVKKRSFSKKNIVNFANVIGIAPGIVVGRLQKDHYLKYSALNGLKIKYLVR